jgi:hypothetical protein
MVARILLASELINPMTLLTALSGVRRSNPSLYAARQMTDADPTGVT